MFVVLLRLTTTKVRARVGDADPFIKGTPSWLLHIASQVTITKAAAGDYLDRAAGIVRTRAETITKRFVSYSRSHDKQQVQQELREFLKARTESLAATLVEKMKDLPRKEDGDIDLQGVGVTPEEFAKQMLAGIGYDASAEDVLDAFLSSRGA